MSTPAGRWRLVASLVYLVVAALITAYVAKLVQDEGGLGGGTDVDGTIRACITRPSGETLEDVGGLAEAKAELRSAVLLPLRYPDAFYRGPRALRPPRGVLLHGPPGTGKTLLARALASESGVPFLALTASALESKWYGDSSKLVQGAFRLARRELAPCIVFFDELDGLGRARSEADQSCVYALKTELLRNLDGADDERDAPVVVLACTNCPRALDPALRRRFPRQVRVDKPDELGRLDILRVLTRDEPADAGVLATVAKETPGRTGSDLAAIFADASAARFDPAGLEAALAAGMDGEQLLAHAGPLSLAHWRRAAARMA